MQTTGERIDWVQLFFNSADRMGRARFVIAATVLIAVFVAYEQAVAGWAHALTGWLVHLILFTAAATVLSKRLHDRGRSGWWSAPALLAFAVVWPEPDGPVDVAFCLVLFWVGLELVLLPGQAGPNRFGPAPTAA